jgi:phosphatidate cytidylyltransferase
VGGLAFSAGVAALLAYLNNTFEICNISLTEEGRRVTQVVKFDVLLAAGAGALLGLVGQFGDLTASIFKRDAGMKDSGSSIPGFGGLLDVLDSPIVAAPIAYWLLAL